MDTIKILVLEDDPVMRESLNEALEDEGYSVVAVGGALEAVEAARRQAFDLVVTDIRMEGMDGLEALERVKLQQPEVRSLVVTGYASEEDTLRAFRLSAAGYLKKPFRLEDFLDMVASLISQRKAEQQQEKHEAQLRQTSRRALEALARVADVSVSPPGRLRQAGQLAGRLAARAGFAAHVCGEIQLGTVLAGGREVLGEDLDFLLETPPPYPIVHSILRHCDERWDVAGESIPLAARLAAVALGRLEEAGLDPHWLARARAGADEDEAQPEFSPRGVLMLAKALHEAGNLEGARATYQEILADPKPRTEAVEALLGLARLVRPAEVEGLVTQAVQLARELGPVSAALSGVEGGLLLARAQSPRAVETLSWASRAAQELGLTAAIAQTLVALTRLQGQGLEQLPRAAEVLLQPAHAGELAEVVDWLVPLALEHYARAPEARYARILGALVASHSRSVLAGLDELSPPARAALVEICGNAKGIPAELAERLGSKAPQEAPESASWLRIFFLGKFDVYRGGERIPENLWKTQKAKQLLGFLALRRQVSDDVAMEHFWPGDMVKGKRSLATALTMIRGALRPEDGRPAPELFHRAQGMLALEAREVWHDVEEFESLYRQARSADEGGDTERAVAAYRRLVQIYRGPFMEGCYLDWALAERSRLEQMAVDSMTRLAQLYQLQGRPRESAECAEKALLLIPESQDLHLLLMRAHMALGRPDQAVRQYEVCRKILDRELGIEPSLALVEAYHRARLGLA
ncbi:MAG: response regulator [Candidatus Eremiobacteraeota bacterium]|nr:response regulator [Candidatus Eremiobacteraeota bacterium]MCW5869312.1 response regulator [Candidatus Eremiobacteraeota bacterium]